VATLVSRLRRVLGSGAIHAARHVRQALAPDSTWLIIEPYAGDTINDNLNPIGRIYYCGSTLLCVPNAMSQAGGYTLGHLRAVHAAYWGRDWRREHRGLGRYPEDHLWEAVQGYLDVHDATASAD